MIWTSRCVRVGHSFFWTLTNQLFCNQQHRKSPIIHESMEQQHPTNKPILMTLNSRKKRPNSKGFKLAYQLQMGYIYIELSLMLCALETLKYNRSPSVCGLIQPAALKIAREGVPKLRHTSATDQQFPRHGLSFATDFWPEIAVESRWNHHWLDGSWTAYL